MSKLTKEFFKEAQAYSQKIVDGLNTSVSPFHSVETVRKLLDESKFEEIKETDSWSLEAGKKYYFTRNNSTICAFTVGNKVSNDNPPDCFKIVGCHTDSPCIRLAPITKTEVKGFKELAVQWYGGGLWHTWMDRDLAMAGRVIVKNDETGKLEDKYWHHEEPLVRIPNMCIHLQSATEREALKLNKESRLKPIIATSIIDSLMEEDEDEESKDDPETGITTKHFKSFLKLIGEEIGSKPENIVDFELSLCDAYKSCIMGLHKEFISSGRLDNMLSSLCATHALIEVAGEPQDNSSINLVYLFDHEEIGSVSDQGAQGTIVKDSTERIFAAFNEQQIDTRYKQALRNSYCVSADMAHAVHPNYTEKHQSLHAPKCHEGIVVKFNCNQRYMTDSVTTALLRAVAEKNDVPLQDFIIKQDLPCGSTIGPALASIVGMKVVDIGAPQLAMHSVREFAGTTDTLYYHKLFAGFFRDFEEVAQDLLDH